MIRRYMLGAGALKGIRHTYVRVMVGDWRRGFEYTWQVRDPEPDEGPGLRWRSSPPGTGQGRGTADPRNPHCRGRWLARVHTPRGPARAVADHNSGLRHLGYPTRRNLDPPNRSCGWSSGIAARRNP